ncbi:hypothetical protein [Mycobacterium sp. E2497]|uniref:hypothetical protein n=1 Tax=Mycobacterium sp. E2497 TaxID=1834135 RepID=UPI0012EA3D59|nr:hypothetical protein [Mycobacterium sp. E2497]
MKPEAKRALVVLGGAAAFGLSVAIGGAAGANTLASNVPVAPPVPTSSSPAPPPAPLSPLPPPP